MAQNVLFGRIPTAGASYIYNGDRTSISLEPWPLQHNTNNDVCASAA